MKFSIVHSFVRSFVRSFICSFIQCFIHSFVRPFVRPFVHSFIHSFTHSFIHSKIAHIYQSLIGLKCYRLSIYQVFRVIDSRTVEYQQQGHPSKTQLLKETSTQCRNIVELLMSCVGSIRTVPLVA